MSRTKIAAFFLALVFFVGVMGARPALAVPPLLDSNSSLQRLNSQELGRLIVLLRRLLDLIALLRANNQLPLTPVVTPVRPTLAPKVTPKPVRPLPPEPDDPEPPLASTPPAPPASPSPPVDDTTKLKNLLAGCAANPSAVCRPEAGTYTVRPGELWLPANITLDLSGITIRAAASNHIGTPHLVRSDLYFLLGCDDACRNVTIKNGRFIGEQRSLPPAEWSEFRALVQIAGGENITIDGATFEKTEGDGITLLPGFVGNRPPPTNIEIRNIVTDRCGRQGVSVISGRGVEISDSVFRNTAGKSPQSAIDVEPGSPLDWATVLIENVRCENNKGACVYAVLSVLRAASPMVDIVARDIVVDGGTFGLAAVYDLIHPDYGSAAGRVLFQNAIINNTYIGFRAGGYEPQAWDTRSRVAVTLDNVRINQPTQAVFLFNFKGDTVAEPVRILPSTTWNFSGSASETIYHGNHEGVIIGEPSPTAWQQALERLRAALGASW